MIKDLYIRDPEIAIYCGDKECHYAFEFEAKRKGDCWALPDDTVQQLEENGWAVIDGVPLCDEHKPMGEE